MTILFDGRASIIGAGPWATYALGPWGETSWWAPDNVANLARNPRRCTLVTDPLGLKGQVIRSELLQADGAAISALATSRRSELSQTSVLQVSGSTYWIKLDTLVQSPWTIDDGSRPVTCFQIHDTPDGGDPARGPPLEFTIDRDRWYIESRSAIVGGTDSSGQVLRDTVGGPLSGILDAWQSWVIKVTWAHTSGGAMTIWRNRRRIFQETGVKNCFNDVAGNFAAHGTYCPVNWPTSPVASRVSYTTGMVIGDASETFASFTGTTELELVTPIRLAAA